ncbi:MAG: type II toxin-antitoxin system VapB family antitoxin [Beijerinckiaceae bacterium]
MQRQLNIRSDRAADLAKRLSAKLGVTAAAVVEAALEDYARKHEFRSTRVTREQAEAFRARLAELVRKANANGPRDLDDKALYDEDGLPK